MPALSLMSLVIKKALNTSQDKKKFLNSVLFVDVLQMILIGFVVTKNDLDIENKQKIFT